MLFLLAIGVGHVFAKYVFSVSGTGTGDVATWSVKVNEGDNVIENIDLSQTTNPLKLVAEKIAPGTSGQFAISIDATGTETGLEYRFNFENEENIPTNMIFDYYGQTASSLDDLENLIGTYAINANDPDKVKTSVIKWKWPYETGSTAEEIAENDIIDTNDQAKGDYTFNLIVEVTQVNPK